MNKKRIKKLPLKIRRLISKEAEKLRKEKFHEEINKAKKNMSCVAAVILSEEVYKEIYGSKECDFFIRTLFRGASAIRFKDCLFIF